MKIIDFLKKYRYIAIILLAIALILYIVMRENKIANLAADKAILELKIGDIEEFRDWLQSENL